MKKYARKLLILFFLVFGILLSGYGIFRIFNATRCKKWPVVKGRIMDSSVVKESELLSNKNVETSLPNIKYEYCFDGQSYFNDTIGYYGKNSLGLTDSCYAGSEDEVIDFIAKYPVDAIVDVYVNPEDPAKSVLDPTLKLSVCIPFFLGLVFIFVAIYIYLFVFSTKQYWKLT